MEKKKKVALLGNANLIPDISITGLSHTEQAISVPYESQQWSQTKIFTVRLLI
jgi:hypothetical protein